MLVAIHWLTQCSKFLLINLKNQHLKNTFFQGGVKIHPPSGYKGLIQLMPGTNQAGLSSTLGAYYTMPMEPMV